MIKSTFIFLVVFLFSCSTVSKRPDVSTKKSTLFYEVDLNDREDDTFDVTLFVNDLSSLNNIYQFAASAPGTYRTMDMGRFVTQFHAFDADGDTLLTERISTNQWKLYQADQIRKITYEIKETWDTPVDSNSIYVMCGTSLEEDNCVINGQAVFGFPVGMQQRPIELSLLYPEEWLVGTALSISENGHYTAKDYDQLVDSPILLGNLTFAETNVNGTEIDIYSYSKNGLVESEEILHSANDILKAADDFLDGLPVNRYTFLFHFENKEIFSAGAWEHNYSSFYSFPESHIEAMLTKSLPGTMAHEFFHIITPLHIHSELVAQFNFENPQPSEHLWLYEGTTEWAAKIMQMRGGLISLEDYLDILSKKLTIADLINSDYSLSELSLNSFSVEGQKEYADIYMRGAITAGMLDIRLLQLSDGERGLREVILELIDRYGVHKSFNENTFFQTFTEMTYPEIADFFKRYIKKNEKLPLEKYFDSIGIKYSASVKTNVQDTTLGWTLTGNEKNQLVFKKVDKQVQAMGLEDNDILISINDQKISMKNIQLINEIKNSALKTPFKVTIERDGINHEISLTKIAKTKVDKHVFQVLSNVSAAQKKLRDIWLKNL